MRRTVPVTFCVHPCGMHHSGVRWDKTVWRRLLLGLLVLWLSVHSAKRKNAEACVLSVCRSAYHLNGKSGYSGENSNGTVHYQSQASSREKAKILPALTQSHIFCFQFEKIPVQHFTANFHWNFLPNVFGQMTNISVQMKASYVPLNSQVKSFIVNKIDMKFFCVVQNNF